MLSEYREVFLEELEEQLQLMDKEILTMEQEGGSEQVVQSLFRAVHTLKGSSAAMGYEAMKQVTHEMEHLLDLVRCKKLPVSSGLIDLLFHSMDCLKQLKNDIVGNNLQGTDIAECIQRLAEFAVGQGQEHVLVQAADTGTSRPPLGLDIRMKVQEARDQGLDVNWVRVQISSDCVIKGARAYVIHTKLNELGDVLFTSPDLEEIDENSFQPLLIDFIYAGSQNSAELGNFVSELSDVVEAMIEPVEAEAFSLVPSASVQSDLVVDNQTQAGKGKSVRVSVERLEHLMNLVGELVIDQTRVQQVERTQRSRFSDDSVDELGQVSDHLSRIIGDLQESVMKARMLPMEQLFNRFPRMVRDLSRTLGKDVDLVLEGNETELDRTLIEEIADPLIHLIRNALDHGIESSDLRTQNGKSPKGTLTLRAAHEDNQVFIYVEDDGAGIDPAKIKKSALNKNILSAEEAELLTDKEAIELIFRPGFSTADSVSDVSGRGVGMDIVKNQIVKLNGLIDIETTLGQGTRFKIKLPLTLAIIVGLLVKMREQTYIIPMSNIAEIVRVTNDDIQTVNGRSVILLRNQVIPVTRLHDLFHIPRPEKEKRHIPLVIVGSAERRVALAVDELIGNQEVVIKSLGSYIGKVEGIAGATILGNGKVALILDISGIIHQS